MANIDNELSRMRNSVYGNEMRDAICDAMIELNNSVQSDINEVNDSVNLIKSESEMEKQYISDSNEYGYNILLHHIINSSTGTTATPEDGKDYACVYNFIGVKKGDIVKFGNIYGRVILYSSSVASSILGFSGNYSNSDYEIPYDCFIRISCRFEDFSDITETDILRNLKIVQKSFFVNPYYKNNIIHSNVFENVGINSANGLFAQSIAYSTTYYISVNNNQRYDLKYSFSGIPSKELNNWIVKVFTFDNNFNFIQPIVKGGTNEFLYLEHYRESLSTESGTRLTSLFFNSEVRYIKITYPSKYMTSLELITNAPIEPIATQYIEMNDYRLANIEENICITGKNPVDKVNELLNVADSYYNKYIESTDGLGNTTIEWILTYSQVGTYLSDTYGKDPKNPLGGIDCSGFVGLVLRGIPFEKTPYNNILNPSQSEGINDGDASEIDSETEPFDGRKLPGNDEYSWSMSPGNYIVPLYSPIVKNRNARVRSAAALGYWLEKMGRKIWIDDGLNNLQPGDVLFFARKNGNIASHPWVQPLRYKHISHVAIVYSKEPMGEEDNLTKSYEYYNNVGQLVEEPRKYKHLIIEVAGNNSADDIIGDPVKENGHWVSGNWSACKKRYLERSDFIGEYANGVDTLIMVCRPDLT